MVSMLFSKLFIFTGSNWWMEPMLHPIDICISPLYWVYHVRLWHYVQVNRLWNHTWIQVLFIKRWLIRNNILTRLMVAFFPLVQLQKQLLFFLSLLLNHLSTAKKRFKLSTAKRSFIAHMGWLYQLLFCHDLKIVLWQVQVVIICDITIENLHLASFGCDTHFSCTGVSQLFWTNLNSLLTFDCIICTWFFRSYHEFIYVSIRHPFVTHLSTSL